MNSVLTRSFWQNTIRELFHSTPAVDDPERLKKTLTTLVSIRVCVLSVVLIAAALVLESHRNSGHIFWPIGALYGISLVNLWFIRRGRELQGIGALQLVTDVALATFAIYFSRSTTANFLYLLLIVGAAVIFRKKGAVMIAALSGICYGVTQYLTQVGSPSSHEILLVYVSLIAIALASAALAEKFDSLDTIALRQAKDLNVLTKHHQQLVADISLGVVTLDIDSTVSSINSAARAIMGIAELSDDQLLGRDFSSILKKQGFDEVETLLAAEAPATQEVALRNGSAGSEIHLHFLARELTDGNGNSCGRVLIFNDVSHVRSMEARLNLHEQMAKLLANDSEIPKTEQFVLNSARMIGQSQIMKSVFTLVDRVAQSDASVLVTGESGTGKEVIAKAIHACSSRRNKPFVAINCGAIPDSLIESELFGHKKGAFTGAIADNPGLFRQANGGTIFLDEIGELPPQMQTKLLRVLQERKVRAVGDVHDISIDVRVIAATNRDLKKEIALNHFREDLYYRLNVVSIPVPPLRERREDIPLLIRHFVGQHCDPDQVLPQISPEAVEMLMNYPFPGNIRELENLIERALVLGGQAILPEHFPEEIRASSKHCPRHTQRKGEGGGLSHRSDNGGTTIHVFPVDLESELARMERDYLNKALERTGGAKKQAAELLGLNFRSFRYRLKKYGLGEEGSPELDDNS